jgi:metal-responsive CopG/Arc/MetJ family transcriptional regulator
MTVEVNLPEELIAQIDTISKDRNQFITDAVRRVLGAKTIDHKAEVDRINAVADELNREAADVLEYQADW